MARNEMHLDAGPGAVFEVLLEPQLYPRWLLGARRIRAVDADWPTTGSRFHHTVGVWPLLVHDSTGISDVDVSAGRWRVRLDVRATPLVRATVTFDLHAHDGGTQLVMEEEPAYRILGNLARPLLDPLTDARNRRSLKKLATVVAERP